MWHHEQGPAHHAVLPGRNFNDAGLPAAHCDGEWAPPSLQHVPIAKKLVARAASAAASLGSCTCATCNLSALQARHTPDSCRGQQRRAQAAQKLGTCSMHLLPKLTRASSAGPEQQLVLVAASGFVAAVANLQGRQHQLDKTQCKSMHGPPAGVPHQQDTLNPPHESIVAPTLTIK